MSPSTTAILQAEDLQQPAQTINPGMLKAIQVCGQQPYCVYAAAQAILYAGKSGATILSQETGTVC